ncbi:unnamed protein product [Prunus armeniaca]
MLSCQIVNIATKGYPKFITPCNDPKKYSEGHVARGALGGLRKEFIAIKTSRPYKVPTIEEKSDHRYCCYHQLVGHPTTASQTLRKILHAEIHDKTLELPSRKQAFDEDPLPK